MQRTCPSSFCRPGQVLLGIVLPSGRVAFASDRVVVTEEFDRIAREGRQPEKRFRFAGPCIQRGCRQWTGERCGFIDRLVEDEDQRGEEIAEGPAVGESGEGLQPCSVRDGCRWFHQHGARACRVCPGVIMDMTPEFDPTLAGGAAALPT
jgi:hypothetical protein